MGGGVEWGVQECARATGDYWNTTAGREKMSSVLDMVTLKKEQSQEGLDCE